MSLSDAFVYLCLSNGHLLTAVGVPRAGSFQGPVSRQRGASRLEDHLGDA